MIHVFLFAWAWLLTATTIHVQAVQMLAKTAPPPPRKRVCCNYIMKEEEIDTGDVCGEEGD